MCGCVIRQPGYFSHHQAGPTDTEIIFMISDSVQDISVGIYTDFGTFGVGKFSPHSVCRADVEKIQRVTFRSKCVIEC